MTRLARTLLITLATVSVALSARAERETVDRIIAVVGNEVILASELAGQLQIVAFQSGRRPQSEAEVTKLRDELL